MKNSSMSTAHRSAAAFKKKIFGRSYDLLDKQEYAAFGDAGAHADKCPSVAGNVAKWTAEIILHELQGKQQEG
ncbi:MAG: hypothetical protein JXA75_02785 [Candidatus Thermoplasmatota archaeon]|nr:hypothetical protein [Candidatus Thermoplasmatota archaeon]